MAEAAASGGRLPLEAYLTEGRRRRVIWTDMRRAVLGLVWRIDRPIGAYEILDRLREGQGKAHLTSVYRCLQCLQSAGLIVPIHSWKRYVMSPDPHVSLWCLLLCDGCRQCAMLDMSEERKRLARRVRDEGFSPSEYAIECRGRCPDCRGAGARA